MDQLIQEIIEHCKEMKPGETRLYRYQEEPPQLFNGMIALKLTEALPGSYFTRRNGLQLSIHRTK